MTTDIKEDLSTAIDCMIEGTYATGFCRVSWGESKDGHELSNIKMRMDPSEAEKTCAEGALIYGAWLRGYDSNYADWLLELLNHRYKEAYGDLMYGDNDDYTNWVSYGDTRHLVISRAKELL